jgi:hypothetical protein
VRNKTAFKDRSFIRLLPLLTLLILCASSPLHGAPGAASDVPDKFAVVSPDGNFIFRQTMESEDGDAAFSVIDARTNRPVLIDPGASLPPMEDSIACLWSPDSRRFAVNARIAGRHETTELFEWTGKQFHHIPSIEATITALLASDRNAQLKRAAVPANTVLRHIWDSYKTLKWEGHDTLKVLGSSTRSYERNNAPEAIIEVVSTFVFTLKFEKHARPKIIARTATHPGQSASDRSSSFSPP